MRALRISSNTSHCFHQAELWSYGSCLIQMLLGMRHFPFSRMQQEGCHTEGYLNYDYLQHGKRLIVANISNRKVTFWDCIVKVIFFAVNLPSQITLLSLRISYVFSSLSPLNLPLSCPEPFVASRARRRGVFKVDVWVGNSANMNVVYGSLPSAFCSPQACGACQPSLVSASPRAHM